MSVLRTWMGGVESGRDQGQPERQFEVYDSLDAAIRDGFASGGELYDLTPIDVGRIATAIRLREDADRTALFTAAHKRLHDAQVEVDTARRALDKLS